jgi:hypothetical protein
LSQLHETGGGWVGGGGAGAGEASKYTKCAVGGRGVCVWAGGGGAAVTMAWAQEQR